MSVAEANALCMQCGLCCDGTFYGSVVVAEEERPRLERIGLRIVQDDGAPSMPQPCSALRGCLCGVYEARPTTCAAYECLLRKNVSNGARSMDQAIAVVAQMRALLAIIRTAFECPASTSIWERILAMEEPATPEAAALASRKYAGAIAAVGDLLALGRAELEPRFAGGGSR